MNIPQGIKGKELYDYLVTNKELIIQEKKVTKTKSEAFDLNLFAQKTVKALNSNYTDDVDSGVIKRDIIANTYNWMDSHYDVHVGNTFKKSIKENQNKIFHLHDHEYKMTAKVGEPEKFEEKEVAWGDIGVNKQGNTTVLMLTSNIMKDYNPFMFSQYLTGKVDQHSVGMMYVKIDLALNDPDYKEEYATWEKYFPMLGNPEKAEQVGFFWAVKEAKLIETSAVLAGSNELTPTVDNEPSKGTQSSEAVKDDSHHPDTSKTKKKTHLFI
jgi:hypothetical protein